jgi:hypothetical protein
VTFLCAHGEEKLSTTNAEIFLHPTISIALGQLLTINEFFKFSKMNRKFFSRLSRPSILKFVGVRLIPFASNDVTPTFSDLLDIEFRLKPEVFGRFLERFLKGSNESGKIKFVPGRSVMGSVWKVQNLKFSRTLGMDHILYSFTYQESTFFLHEVEENSEQFLLHYVRLKPDEKKKLLSGAKMNEKIFVSLMYDLDTKSLETHLWERRIPFDLSCTLYSKRVCITPANCKKLVDLMSQQNQKYTYQNKHCCVIM